MKTIKPYSSYVTIKNILEKAGFIPLDHKAINLNGAKHGFFGFWKNNDTGRIIYTNTDFFPTMHHHTILIRAAESTKDFKGGFNNFASTDEELISKAKWLTTGSCKF